MSKGITQICLEIFGTFVTIRSQAFTQLQRILTIKNQTKMVNDKGETLVAVALTNKEIKLLSSLVTLHVHRLESLVDTQPSALPTHKEWMYDLEDKLDDL